MAPLAQDPHQYISNTDSGIPMESTANDYEEPILDFEKISQLERYIQDNTIGSISNDRLDDDTQHSMSAQNKGGESSQAAALPLNIDNEGNHLPCGSSEGSPSFATPQDTFSGQHPPPNPQKKFPYVVWDGIVWRNLRSITPRCHECVVHVKRCVMTPRGCESCQNFGVHCVFLNHQGTRIWLAKNP